MSDATSVKTMPAHLGDIDTTGSVECPSHEKKFLRLYCAFCERPVCEKCKVSTHARHVTEIKGQEALIAASKSRRKFLIKLVENKERVVVTSHKTLILQLSESKANLQSKINSVVKRYKYYASIHRDKLSVSEDKWIDDVTFRGEKYFKLIDEKIDFLKLELSNVVTTLEIVQRQIETANNTEVLIVFGTLRAALMSLYEPKWPRENISVSMKLENVPQFGSFMFQKENEIYEKNCVVEFSQEITEPTVFVRVFDAKLPIPKRVLQDDMAKISLCSADELFVSFGEYIVVYPLDNRRYAKVKQNVGFTSIMTVRQNIIDISCDRKGNLYYAAIGAIKLVTSAKKRVRKCFTVVDVPSAIVVGDYTDGRREIYTAFHDAGKIVRYSTDGDVLMELTHHDPKMVYRPRHIDMNFEGDIFFSDDISNITILDNNGIWKGAITRDVKTTDTCGPLRPEGIACSPQRHLFVLDSNHVPNLHIFSEEGKYLQTAAFKNLNEAYSVNVDRSGDVWIAFKDGRIRIYRPRLISKLD